MAARRSLTPRKRPRQERSRETVEVILEAAARVFAERGHAKGTTNRIAEAAGVSVGSLYEYFPNKDAILVALAERHLEHMMSDVLRSLADAEAADAALPELLHSFVETMLVAHEQHRDLHRVVFSEAPHPPELHACVLQMEGALAHTLEALLQQRVVPPLRDADAAAHLVVQTVEALTHRYVHHGLHDLSRGAFVLEVVTLLEGYLDRAIALPPAHDAEPGSPV